MSHQQVYEEKVFDTSQVFAMGRTIHYAPGGIVSKQVIKKEHGNVTLFAFDQHEELSEHTSPYDAMILVVEGEARISIGGKSHHLQEGESIIMPANIPHAVFAPGRFKMVLTMIR